MARLLVGDALQHAAPQQLLYRHLRNVKLHLEKEPPLEGLVEVGSQVGRSDEYAVQVLHFLKDDVLHGIVHLVYRLLHVLRTLVENGIGLVEKEDGHHLAALAYPAVGVEHPLDVLLSLPHELVAHTGDVNLQDVAACAPCYLQHRLRLARSRSTVEETGEALAHPLVCQPLLYGWKVFLAQ